MLGIWDLTFEVLTLVVLTAGERTTGWSTAYVKLLCEWGSHITNYWVRLTASISFSLWSDCSLHAPTFLKWRRERIDIFVKKNCLKVKGPKIASQLLAGDECEESKKILVFVGLESLMAFSHISSQCHKSMAMKD